MGPETSGEDLSLGAWELARWPVSKVGSQGQGLVPKDQSTVLLLIPDQKWSRPWAGATSFHVCRQKEEQRSCVLSKGASFSRATADFYTHSGRVPDGSACSPTSRSSASKGAGEAEDSHGVALPLGLPQTPWTVPYKKAVCGTLWVWCLRRDSRGREHTLLGKTELTALRSCPRWAWSLHCYK